MTTLAAVVLTVLTIALSYEQAVESSRRIYKLSSDGDEQQESVKEELADERRLFRRNVSPKSQPITNDSTIPVESTNHKYYTSAPFPNRPDLFLDLNHLLLKNDSNVYHHVYLSNAYGRVHARKLRFKFPFYGHFVDSVRIATGGFLHIGPVFHSFITETQYVAPLMANFNPKLKTVNKTDSKIFVYDDGERFITQWDSVALQDQQQYGQFTFQVSLFKNGSIVFAYKTVPVRISAISRVNHAVRVGLSDAFILTRKVHDFVHRRIYRYHVVQLNNTVVADGTAYKVHPVRNCVTAQNCNECLTGDFPGFTCAWCSKLSLCSDTYDWNRQSWLEAGCNTLATRDKSKCSESNMGGSHAKRKSKNGSKVSPGVVTGSIILVILIILILCGVGFYFYAHTHPNTRAGLYVIEHGPRTWFRKKENIVC